MAIPTQLVSTSDGDTVQVLVSQFNPPTLVIQGSDAVVEQTTKVPIASCPTQTSEFKPLSESNITLGNLVIIKKIGTHIARSESRPSLSQCLTDFSMDCGVNGNIPCQMFLRNPHRGSEGITDDDFDISRHVIEANDLRYYTHAAYIINLSKPTTKRNPNSDKWIMSLLTKDLDNTNRIGGKGVVVHIGKSLDMPVTEATDKMEFYIRQALEHATEQCPLLLETAAGQGTELCVSIEELSSFYGRFSENERKVFKICVDTCHIFSAGYDPLDFLIQWEQLHPNSIGLVHFNDSERSKGSRVDRHSYYLKGGFIGFERLMEVAAWCLEHDIDMVTE